MKQPLVSGAEIKEPAPARHKKTKAEMLNFAASDFELATAPQIKGDELEIIYGTPDLFDRIFRSLEVRDYPNPDDTIAEAVGASSCTMSFLESSNITLVLCFSTSNELNNAVDGQIPQKLADVATKIRDDLVAREQNRHRSTLKTYGVMPK